MFSFVLWCLDVNLLTGWFCCFFVDTCCGIFSALSEAHVLADLGDRWGSTCQSLVGWCFAVDRFFLSLFYVNFLCFFF